MPGRMAMMQLYILIGAAVVAFGGGFYTSSQFHDAKDYKAAQEALVSFQETAQKGVDTLQNDWKAKHNENVRLIVAAQVQRNEDESNESAILEGLDKTQSELREIAAKFSLLDDIDVCRFSPDFVRLWNEAAKAANTKHTSSGSGSTTGSDSEE